MEQGIPNHGGNTWQLYTEVNRSPTSFAAAEERLELITAKQAPLFFLQMGEANFLRMQFPNIVPKAAGL